MVEIKHRILRQTDVLSRDRNIFLIDYLRRRAMVNMPLSFSRHYAFDAKRSMLCRHLLLD